MLWEHEVVGSIPTTPTTFAVRRTIDGFSARGSIEPAARPCPPRDWDMPRPDLMARDLPRPSGPAARQPPTWEGDHR